MPILFSGCEAEKELYENSGQNNRNKITLNEFMKETGIRDFHSVFKVPEAAINQTLNKTAELSEFIIDTVAIQKFVSENDKTTYSFRIYSIVSNIQYDEKYNLVYMKENAEWEKSIISFKEKLNATQNAEKFEEFQKLYDSRIANTTLSAGIELCFSENYSVHCDGSCSTGVCDGFGCSTGQCIIRTIKVEPCFSAGGSPSGPSIGNSNNNGGGSGLNPYQFVANIEGNQNFDTNYINQYRADRFFRGLVNTAGAQEWVNQNIATYNLLIEHQIQNNWSSQSFGFAMQMINSFLSDSYTPEQKDTLRQLITVTATNSSTFTIDDSVNVSNSMVFDSTDELEAFLNSNEGNSQSLEGIELADTNNDYIGTYKFGIATLGGVEVFVKFSQGSTGSAMTVTDVTSQQYGTTFSTWTQQTYTKNTKPNNKVRIDIYGNLFYDFTVGGVGVKSSTPYHLTIIIDTITSGVESISWSHH